MGDSVSPAEETLPISFETAEAVAASSTSFGPAPGASVEDLLASPWRAHMAFRLPADVVPHPDLGARLFDALEYRSPNPEYVDGVIYLNFTVEDGGEWGQQLVADVGHFVLSLIGGSTQAACDIVYHVEEAKIPRLRLIPGRRRT